ncbi:NAD-dependent epimerase/dehydratase family protein [Hansschlegelia zhihuaiae]|uniref:SDR family oxidoreductase n=1 Tax=Hansschlegelia zhihuaiae TaxID=405005 RepID=A0A4Q0MC86_9HYPH|nr:SDR family oxidoreductase [Hansschlegelia zhihuaiae]RXF70930.1 SDR family oxidoreductase [Hansschlegelia zhihuaiae]
MKVLVTGADGYIGCILTPYLMQHGHEVAGLDAGFYRAGLLFHDDKPRPRTITRDTRDVTPDDLAGFEAVVHLAELSNDPLADNDVETTYSINLHGSLGLAHAAKRAGVKRFVYASSCSVYGVGASGVCSEASDVNPLTAYAECKVLCERGLSELADSTFTPVFLRNATAFGASPRMRFDIVLNNLSGLAATRGVIDMSSDGSPWRPLVHVQDICQAVDLMLAAAPDRIRGEAFNVGDDAQNYRVRDIAEIVARSFPGCATLFGPPSPDNRSYRVSFAKIHAALPEFVCRWRADDGARELWRVFNQIGMTRETFEAAPFTRLKALKALMDAGQLDHNLRWAAFNAKPEAVAEYGVSLH